MTYLLRLVACLFLSVSLHSYASLLSIEGSIDYLDDPNNLLSSELGLNNINIGLLGGSFNPAHKGHTYISDLAIKTLNLKQLWWLVTSQNPLKEIEQKEGCKPSHAICFGFLRSVCRLIAN